MGPLADWVCLSKKCLQDGANTVYFDLPISTRFCPTCGSKRIKRLYNQINVLRGVPDTFLATKRTISKFVDDAGQEAEAKQDRATSARLQAAKQEAPMFAVPLKQLGPALAQFGIQAPQINMAGSRPSFNAPLPVMNTLRHEPPRPGPGSLKDNARITSEGKVVADA